ncbi:hypothetical protein G7046_g8893 [Stylonectria norvegica]|nr:hypothetical protein G7046_g8893 [Stylonectria norvegica]
MKFTTGLSVAAAAGSLIAPVAGAYVAPKELNISDHDSIRDVAASIAYGTMSYYKGNVSKTAVDMGNVPKPYYWWVAGGLWGAMLDYYHFTKDPSYNDVIIQALLAPTNLGNNSDYMPVEHQLEEGNDDLFFWGSAVISAAERNFPQPDESLPSWLEMGANVFNELAGRWNSTHCGGGLLWQIFPANPNGMNYKNSVSNGGFFQLAARMARATGNDTYLEWAERIYDWSSEIGFIDPTTYHVFDGTDSANNCSSINHHSFTYTSGIYLFGAAILADHTGKAEWATRAEQLLNGTNWFFSPLPNSTNVMYEAACEGPGTCNYDMVTFKGYLSRFLWQSAQLLPSLRPKVNTLLETSAQAAAKGCSGGKNGQQCSLKWYVNGFDGNPGLGQQMCALETIQGLLIDDADKPFKGDEIKVVRNTTWDDQGNATKTISSTPTQTSEAPEETTTDSAATFPGASMGSVSLGLVAVMLCLGLA